MRCTVKKTLKIARENRCDVLVQVKGNQPELLASAMAVTTHIKGCDRCEDVDKGHGRVEWRRVTRYCPAGNWWPEEWQGHIAALYVVEREVTGTRQSKETAVYVCTTPLSAIEAAQGIRQHWQIENANHHVRDVTLREDACRGRYGARTLACLRSIVLNRLRLNDIKNVAHALYANSLKLERAIDYLASFRI